ncbi:hypothetical protein PoB_004645900 [Plakobranchus ocellatus]|uniref:Uncharacterized protein n=1 Tax=Plakobranchus ocellatus TaxID=259542 RepID=A0AAV4BIM0_9GAST|nr:hypothetical protein PoB_004645900 [Plakobranchus ocellatus]
MLKITRLDVFYVLENLVIDRGRSEQVSIRKAQSAPSCLPISLSNDCAHVEKSDFVVRRETDVKLVKNKVISGVQTFRQSRVPWRSSNLRQKRLCSSQSGSAIHCATDAAINTLRLHISTCRHVFSPPASVLT